MSWFRQRFVINTMYSLEHQSLEMVAMTTFEICCSETSGVTSACQAKKLLWNQLLWLWAKSLKSKNSPERSTTPKMYSSFVRLPKIFWWLGSNSKQQVHGQFGNHRGFSSANERQSSQKAAFASWLATRILNGSPKSAEDGLIHPSALALSSVTDWIALQHQR